MWHKETAREFRRRRAATLMQKGWGIPLIAEALGVTPHSVYRWRELAQSENGLALKPLPGRPPKLTDQQIEELKILMSKGATANGWINDLWTTKRVATLIRRRFGAGYDPGQVGRIIKQRMGWSLQRPATQLRSRDDAEIERWLTEEYPRILARARRRHAYLVFIDESGFMLSPLLRRTYAPRGEQPISKCADPHGRISVIGAITISPEQHRFGFQFYLAEDNVNFHGYSIVPFIDTLRRWIGGPFTIVWDRILIHNAKPLADYFMRYRHIVNESFPPGVPELNPADNVWGYVKYGRLPNYTPPDLKELRRRISTEFSRLQNRPDLLRAFFRRTGLTLDPREPVKFSWTPNGRLVIGERGASKREWPS
jgi:transposase